MDWEKEGVKALFPELTAFGAGGPFMATTSSKKIRPLNARNDLTCSCLYFMFVLPEGVGRGRYFVAAERCLKDDIAHAILYLASSHRTFTYITSAHNPHRRSSCLSFFLVLKRREA
jgi:hypothetical protein